MTVSFTVFGARGYIGRHLVDYLENSGFSARKVLRGNWPMPGENLGHAIFTIGMTGDFLARPFDTVRSHVVCLEEALENYRYESFLLLSSTRVYRGAASTVENTDLTVNPSNADHIYNITKLAGESLCLAMRHRKFRIARVSNVIGGSMISTSFLAELAKKARRGEDIHILSSAVSSKDYIFIGDVCRQISSISQYGERDIYNVASGRNTTNAEIASVLERHGCTVRFSQDATETIFPTIDVRRFQGEFNQPVMPFATALETTLQPDQE